MTTSKTTRGKAVDASLAKELVAGIAKHFATTTQLSFGGQTVTTAQLTTSLEALAQLRSDVNTARAAADAKLATEQAKAPPLRALMSAFVAFVHATFTSPDDLADFGLEARKAATPLTVQQKAAATAKREATRKARGTTGPKQKKAVKGNVTDVEITPVTAIPAPASPAPVAPPAPSGGGAAPAAK